MQASGPEGLVRVMLESVLRMRVPRLYATVVLGTVLALAALAPAMAADPSPPPDVVFDATVTVLFVADSGPVDHADVKVTASRDGVTLATATAQTDPTGTATMTGLPRATSGAPVLLDITVRREDPPVDLGSGCWSAEFWNGSADDVVSDVHVEVQLQTLQHSTVLACPRPPTSPPAAPTEPANASLGPELTLPPTDIAADQTGAGSRPLGPGIVLIGVLACASLLLGLRRAAR